MSLGGYVAAGVIAVVLTFFGLPFIRARSMHGKPAPDLAGIVPGNHERVLLYFFSHSCGMCKSITPIIDRLAVSHPNVVKIDVVQSLDLARAFGVMGTPTTVLVRDSKVEKMWVGTRSEAQLRRALQDG